MARVHWVAQGECLATIAARYGFRDPAAIFDHPENAALRARRSSPHVLAPGDEVHVPDADRPPVACATGATHRFRGPSHRTRLHVVLRDHEGEPLGGVRYRVHCGERTIKGRATAAGLVACRVPVSAERARLLVWLDDDDAEEDAEVFDVRIGHLDPLDDVSGAQARLANLGYPCGASGAIDDHTRAAIAAFQRRHGLRVSGELDAATRRSLLDRHEGT